MSAKGLVFLIHGLNNRPDVLDPFGAELASSGFVVERIGLRGHRPGESLWESSAQAWLDETEAQIQKANRPSVPVFVLAYSLGAAVIAALLNRGTGSQITRSFYLAPALRFTKWARPRRLLAPLGSLPLALPSLAPREIRVTSWTPLRAYRGLFDLADSLEHVSPVSPLHRIETQVLLLQGDELVSREGVQSWMQENNLRSWQMIEPPPGFFSGIRSKHSVNIRSRYTAGEWEWLAAGIRTFFTK